MGARALRDRLGHRRLIASLAALAAVVAVAGQASAQTAEPATISCYVQRFADAQTYQQTFALRSGVLHPIGAPWGRAERTYQPILLIGQYKASTASLFREVGSETGGGAANAQALRLIGQFSSVLGPRCGAYDGANNSLPECRPPVMAAPYIADVYAMDTGASLGSMNFRPKEEPNFTGTDYSFDLIWSDPQMIAKMTRPVRIVLSSAGRPVVRYEVDARGLDPAAFVNQMRPTIAGKTYIEDWRARRALPKTPGVSRNCP